MLLEQISLHALIKNHQIKTETGQVLDFDKYRFMFDIYADRSPLMTCMKCAQIGFTTYEILTSAHECKNEGIDIIYVLPTGSDVNVTVSALVLVLIVVELATLTVVKPA